jgi:hypothetical protein
MANVLEDEKKEQIIALGRLGWSLRKIQQATRVRRETISAYLRGAGVEIWPPGRWKREGKAKPAIQVITGLEAANSAIPRFTGPLNPNPENLPTKGQATATSKPAIIALVCLIVCGLIRARARVGIEFAARCRYLSKMYRAP